MSVEQRHRSGNEPRLEGRRTFGNIMKHIMMGTSSNFGNMFSMAAHPLLTATSLAVVTIAVLLAFTPIGTYFGFVPLPARFYFILGAMVLVYLFVVELAKQGFYRWSAAGRRPRRSATLAWPASLYRCEWLSANGRKSTEAV